MNADGGLTGQVLEFPDKWWGFEAANRKHHPAACTGYQHGGFKAVVVKGTDIRSARYHYAEVIIEPDPSNGLKKTTSFAINPKVFSGNRVGVLDQMGTLRQSDLERLQVALQRQFGIEEGD